MRPFLKWPGGKMRLLNEVLVHLDTSRVLVEPFVGAGAVFLNSEHPRYILNDINPDLIALYRALKREKRDFINEAKKLFSKHYNKKEKYLKIRSTFNATSCQLERAMLFLYLNRHGFNGLCRYNLKGGYNVPFGSYVKPYFPEAELNAFIDKASRYNFHCGDFRKVLSSIPAKSVIYCDPPYLPLTKTAQFSQYHGQFNFQLQEELASQAKKLAKAGHTVVISNHDTPLARELYQGAQIKRVKVSRSISCKKHSRKKVPELLAVFD